MQTFISPTEIIFDYAWVFVLALTVVLVYNIVVITLLIRMLFNKQVRKKINQYLHNTQTAQSGGVMSKIFMLLWRSLRFEYFDDLSKNEWMSKGLQWHIRIFRYMFYALMLLILLLIIGLVTFFVQTMARSYSAFSAI